MNYEQLATESKQGQGDKATRERGFTVLDLLVLLVNYLKMILLVSFAAAILTAVYALTEPNIYTAKTTIIPSEDDKGMIGAMVAQMGSLAAIAGSTGLGGPTKGDLYVTMLNTETVCSAIVDRFKLMEVYHAKYRSDAFKRLNRNSSIHLGKKDGVITIQVDDTDPKRAAEIANSYVEELGRMAMHLNSVSAGNTRKFLDERLNLARVDLAAAEESLKEFQTRNKAISVTDQARATIEGVAQLRSQLALQEVQLGTYRRQFTDNSQEMRSTMASIANLKAQISKLEGGGSGSSIPAVGSVPNLAKEYLRLMREFKVQEVLVETLSKQSEVVKLSEAKNVSPVQVLEKASIPERKSKPRRTKMVLFSAVSGFFGALAFAFARESFLRLPDEQREAWRSVGRRVLYQCKSTRGNNV